MSGNTNNLVSKNERPITAGAAFAVYMLYLNNAGLGATTPAIASLAAAFPDVSYTLITLVQTLPSLTMLVGLFLMGAIAGNKISFKTAGTVSLLVYLVFGILPTFWHSSIYSILVARALVGFGMGLLAPLGPACFLRMVRDKESRATYLGRGNAVMQIGCVILTLAGGWLCAIHWTYTFLAYLLCLVALIGFLPTFKEPPTVQEIIAAEGAASAEDFRKAERVSISATAWFFLFLFGIGQLVCGPIMMNFSSLMEIRGAGGPGTAGVLLSVFVFAGAISSSITDKICKMFGKFTGLVAFIIAAIGALIIAVANSAFMFGVGIFVVGIGWILVHPMINLETGMVTGAAGLAWIASLSFIFRELGTFLSTFWNALVLRMFGQSFASPYYAAAVGFIILGIIWAVFNLRNPVWKEN